MYRKSCRGLRPCLLTVSLLVAASVLWRALLLMEGQGGALAGHGLTIPRLNLHLTRKPLPAAIPLEFLLEQRTYCADRPGLLAVALIPSRVNDSALRQETRNTWASALSLGLPLGGVFLLGRPTNKEERRQVKAESLRYGDVVQGDYDDAHQASKTLNGVLWLAMHCAMVPFTIQASDKVLLDVFLLQSFLWEVLEAPEKQGMLFGLTSDYAPPVQEVSSGWSLNSLREAVSAGGEEPVYPPYLSDGAWFGRTQAVAKLLSASGGVPLVSPATMYLTGLVASAAGLHKSPELFNAWWRTDHTVRTDEIGMVLGWLNDTLVPSRSQVWELLKKHHNHSATGQMVKRDAVVNLTMNPNKQPAKLIKYSNPGSSANHKKGAGAPKPKAPQHHIDSKQLKLSPSTKLPLSKVSAVISRETFHPSDPKLMKAYLLRKEQLRKMIRTSNPKSKAPKQPKRKMRVKKKKKKRKKTL